MFYKMIENKRNQWLSSAKCTISSLIDYIMKTGQMYDAQIEAIKTYLFLKIACGSKSLATLFKRGAFNSLDLSEIELSQSTREYLLVHPAAAALFEYACMKNDGGEQVSAQLEKVIKKFLESIDYNKVWNDTFYGVSYTDYLFSLPMGAGKTYLMAAFIYLDLYFAMNEPHNPIFAHNFIIFAPSGLKSSVVPSLKTIQDFNQAWIIPEPAATDIKRIISFEVLDQSKTEKKAFCDKCSFSTREGLIPEEANLLNIANFTSIVQTDKPQDYYPDAKTVENIISDDRGKLKVDPKMDLTIQYLEESGNDALAETLRKQNSSHPQKNRSFHYLPYRTDSAFEQTFLTEVLGLDDVTSLGLEVYYNGDRAMTEFKIKCYKNASGKWCYVGLYTPDFLIIKRKDGKVHKAIIVETKGDIYKNDPTFKDKRTFMETEFAKKNNEAFGYNPLIICIWKIRYPKATGF